MEHIRDKLKQREESPLVKHDKIYHKDKTGGARYMMKIIQTHRKPMQRQILESVLINSSKADIPMNSKNEYNRQKIPRIFVDIEEWNRKEEELN